MSLIGQRRLDSDSFVPVLPACPQTRVQCKHPIYMRSIQPARARARAAVLSDFPRTGELVLTRLDWLKLSTLIKAWEQFSGPAKPRTEEAKLNASHEFLVRIDDPAIRVPVHRALSTATVCEPRSISSSR